MEKITITKKDSVPRIVEKILESKESEIVLLVSAGSALKESLSNMELVKREAEAAGKSISIDSGDPEVIELAEKAGIGISSARALEKGSSQIVFDIVAVKYSGKDKDEEDPPKHGKSLKIEEAKSQSESFWDKAKEEAVAKKQFAKEIGSPPAESEKHERKVYRRARGKKAIAYISGVVVIALAAFWVTGAFFGKAEVTLGFKKIPWQYQGTVTVSKTFSQVDSSKNYLPGEIFTQQKNVTRLFPASGSSNVSQKATAKILVYNAYSSSKQTLVATTRFETPDGKIFRLDNSVVVPGADINNGKITPSSIEASVTADQPGVDYNIGPIDKLTIPGFKGTARYDGFYGAMPQAASGGFIGKKQVPTDQDIASAEATTTQGLKDVLQSGLTSGIPDGFNVPDGASSVSITKISVNKATDGQGNFGVFGEASFQSIGFKEDDLNSLVQALMLKDNPGMDFRDVKTDFQNVKADFAAGQLTFSLVASGDIGPKFSEDDLKSSIAGKPLNDAKSSVLSLPDLENAKISLWPFWLNSIPKNVSKITVNWN
ncbi:MAG TPA: hypothetical protein VMV71_00645 [Candidatus Paceibacterota bacterium]|nr:hypothetical protein [Candidatus Paceibacterota bacterium]